MKKLFLGLLTMVILVYSACDVVDDPYYVVKPGDTIPDTIPEVVKKVLLEDYTGHTCVYCAGAAIEAEDLKEEYGDRLIVMAVHAGFFAWPVPGDEFLSDDFRTDAGEEWNTFFNVEGNPIGMVDRLDNSGSYLVPVAQWNAKINQRLQDPVQAGIVIENDYEEATRKLTTTVKTTFVEPQTTPLNLLVCITQDSIISGQKNNDENVGETPLIEEYVFMHMLRGSMNGNWGEAVVDGDQVEVGVEYTRTYSITFPQDWVPGHCHVVAFIFERNIRTVLQADEEAVLQ